MNGKHARSDLIEEFRALAADQKFATVLADPPWQFINRTGKVAPEHRRLSRYGTMSVDEICELPVAECLLQPAHLYLWVRNALLPEGLLVMKAWGFQYKSNIVWHKLRKDGAAMDAGGFLLSQRDRDFAIWNTRKECSNFTTRTDAGELYGH